MRIFLKKTTKKKVFIALFPFFLSAHPTYAFIPARYTGLDSELTGFFAGLSRNSFTMDPKADLNGWSWQAGIIQKTERRIYGYLTGLLYFDRITAQGRHPDYGSVSITSNDVVFSLWMTELWRINQIFAPSLSVGPAFVFHGRSTIDTDDEEIIYRGLKFDLKIQAAAGGYIRLKKDLYLLPQIVWSYNLLNNSALAKKYDISTETNINFQLAMLYATEY